MVKEKIFGNLEYPKEKIKLETDELRIIGWSFSSLGEPVTIQVLIDNIISDQTMTGKERKDVYGVFPSYKIAASSGFDAKIKLQGISDGEHFLKVISKSNGIEKIISKLIPIELVSEKIIGDVTLPYDYDVNTTNELEIKGCCFSTRNNDIIISISIDGKKITETTTNIQMSGVYQYYPQFESSLVSGFFVKLNISEFQNGNHILKIVANTINKEKIFNINFELKRSD